jgi:acyl dehydratase
MSPQPSARNSNIRATFIEAIECESTVAGDDAGRHHDATVPLSPLRSLIHGKAMSDLLYLDDLVIGQCFGSATKVVDEGEVTAFARLFDPQPFHLDREAAANSRFGGLVASGWHTGAMTMRLLVDNEFRIAGGIVDTGFDEFRWITPVRPGDTLHLETEVVDVRRSTRKPMQGAVKVRITTLNQNTEPVQILLANLAVPGRSVSSMPGNAN